MSESEYIHKSHNVPILLYHFVCPAKYRKVVFDKEVDETLKEVCLEIEKRYEVHFLEIGTDKNHVHFLIQSVPSKSPTQIIKMLKSNCGEENFGLMDILLTQSVSLGMNQRYRNMSENKELKKTILFYTNQNSWICFQILRSLLQNSSSRQNMTKKEKVDELIIANKEKQKRADGLIIANKELAYQNDEKEKRATELILANEVILQSEENIEIINAGSAEHKEVQLKNLKILIVEDNEVSYSLLIRMLQRISREVLHEITGIKAVEDCRKNPDLDLVLMDIRMPQMDGNEATRQIRQFNKDIIIFAQTAYAFSGDFEKAIEAGCNDYISKPIDKTILYELINKHVNKSRITTNKIYQQ